MDGIVFLETLQEVLPATEIERITGEKGIVQRRRKLDITKLVYSLALSAGSDDSGVLAEAMKRYNSETVARQRVVRGGFYAWLDNEVAELMEHLVERAIWYACSLPAFLPGILGGVSDWYAFDSETITLRPALAEAYPGSGSPAAVKVHKELSLGRGCMTGYHFGPAREHDSPHLFVDERYEDAGLLYDLGYVSLERIRQCDEHNVKFVQRLKDSWKPRVTRITSGEVLGEFIEGSDFDELLMNEVISLAGSCADADVTLGQGNGQVSCRLVMIPSPSGYLIYLTNLPRETHGPQQVGDLYRVRWEIEMDNKLDKCGAQLDQIRATTESSVRIQLAAKLLHSMIVDLLIHRDNLERVKNGRVCRGPLHRLALAYSIRSRHVLLVAALLTDDTTAEQWDNLADQIIEDGRDPNWRSRPSVLDRLLGLTAPRGRPRKKKLRDCRPEAAPYRKAAC